MTEDNFWDYFYEIFEDLPRQGPGAFESTKHALRSIPTLTKEHRILDIGSGTGTQTFDLAALTDAQIVAVDNHPPFINAIAHRSAELGFGNRIAATIGDMADLKFPNGSFDVVWSEGAVFIIGFSKGLADWHRLVKSGGYMVISESCWLKENPPAELLEFFTKEGADIETIESRKSAISANGYHLIDNFVLPEKGWRENYYAPMLKVLDRFKNKYFDNPDALAVASRCQHEIDLYEKYSEYYGYVFFVMKV